MTARVYFDTDTFRQIGRAFRKAALSADLREHLLVSPLSAFEVLSQLSITKGNEILREIQAIRNWIDPQRAGLLPWPDDVLAHVGFGQPLKKDDFTQHMQHAFNVCLAATSVDPLREEAGKLKDTMDQMKERTAEQFGRLLHRARKDSPEGEWFSKAWFQGIVKRVKADAGSRSATELAATFSAYHEFERVRLKAALQSTGYNPKKHQNDLLDAEQLIYLSCPELHFLTCDGGFKRVNKSPQAVRIKIVPPHELADTHKIEALLKGMIRVMGTVV